MIYEFITPSDPITFSAENESVAFYVCLSLGGGKAGYDRCDGNDCEYEALLGFADSEAIKNMVDKAFKGDDAQAFVDKNREAICDAFNSFMYGSESDRAQYEAALDAITDPDKLKEFKAKHEDLNRSSMSEWVAYAWERAESHKERGANE